MSSPAAHERPLAGLALATMFRGDPAQLLQWCNFHLNAGAERLYVVLDRPDEALLALVPDDARVVFVPVDEQTWSRFYAAGADNVERKQVDAFRWLAGRAQADGHSHLGFVDTDELVDLAVPFARLAQEYADAPSMTLPVREMWYAEGGHTGQPFGATVALRWQERGGVWNEVFDWRAQYFRNGMLGHDAGKSIYRLPLASGSISVHGPLTGVLRARRTVLPDEAGRLLHFDSGNVVTWNHKWGSRLTGGVVAHGLGGHRRAQLRLFAHELRRSPEEQRRFFERFFTLDDAAMARLDAAGLVDRVEIASMLDQPLAVPPPADESIVQLPGTPQRVDVQFAMVCDQNFVKPTFATLISVLAQIDPAKTVRFVILGDGLADSDVARFKSLERTEYQLEVQVHDITRDLDRDVGHDLHKRSRATYGRVYLVDLLPEQRTIYLDGDVLATRDISELFSLDLGDACLAGVPDSAALRAVADPGGVGIDQRMRLAGVGGPDPREYLNAGVLMHDLDHPDYRELALRTRGIVVRQGRALVQHDQDALNLAFKGRKHRLPSTYNYMTQFYTSERALDGDLISLKYSAADASLIHFSGKVKPWITAEDEFYNALYRRIVLAAEERLGVNCGFYFSTGTATGHRDWSAQHWEESLSSHVAPEAAEGSTRTGDVELVDLTDTACYLHFTADSYVHAVRAGLRLVARVAGDPSGTTLFEIPLDRFGPPLAHLLTRVGPGVRVAPIDLEAALAPYGGIARHVELALVAADEASGFARSIAVVQVLAAGASATPDLLDELAIEARLDGEDDGVLAGSYRAATTEPMALHIGGELASLRLKTPEEKGARAIRFRPRDLVRNVGYGAGGDAVTVRVAGTNVPVPGVRLTVDELHAEPAPAAGNAGPQSQRAAAAALAARVASKARRRLGRRG